MGKGGTTTWCIRPHETRTACAQTTPAAMGEQRKTKKKTITLILIDFPVHTVTCIVHDMNV